MSLEAFEAMRYGPLGDAVLAAEPHTEADPIGVYAAMLALWSSAINGPVTLADGRPVVVWTVLVGESALGRKGTALRVARKTLDKAIGGFLEARIEGGVTSGASLTRLLYEKQEETEGTEGGTDTRVVIVEQEWAQNLRRQNSDSTYSSKLRACWDGEPVRSVTTKERLVVDVPRLGLHAHISPGEWAEYIRPRDAKGGSYNRMLPVSVVGSKVLPWGHKEKYPDATTLAEAYDWARSRPRRMTLSKEAATRFDELRAEFLAKMMTTPEYLKCYIERTPEQIIRVAAVLTATEQRTTVNREAVEAAWAFVRYSMKSVEGLVREDTSKSPGRTPKSLPELIRGVISRYGGEVKHSDMLRALGIRATAHSLRKALETMDDVRVITGVSLSGVGRPGTFYRWTEEVQEPEKQEAPAEPTPEPVAAPVAVPDTVPETRELTLSVGWL